MQLQVQGVSPYRCRATSVVGRDCGAAPRRCRSLAGRWRGLQWCSQRAHLDGIHRVPGGAALTHRLSRSSFEARKEVDGVGGDALLSPRHRPALPRVRLRRTTPRRTATYPVPARCRPAAARLVWYLPPAARRLCVHAWRGLAWRVVPASSSSTSQALVVRHTTQDWQIFAALESIDD